MLLFFIAQISTASASCKVSSSRIINETIEVISCDKGLNKTIQIGVDYWNNKGYDLIFNNKTIDCNNIEMEEYNKIYFQINNEKVKEADKNGSNYGARTITWKNNLDNTFLYAITYAKDDYYSRSNLLGAHEIGHALGFKHVDDSCVGYIMNIRNSKMGTKF